MTASERMKTITVFGGSSYSEDSDVYAAAYSLGRALAREGFVLCNGGYGGTMAAAAKGASESGGRTVGITLSDSPNRWIQRNDPQPDHWRRMQTLLARGDGYVVLPGGTGTLAELGVLLESINKGIITRSPIVLLKNYWTPLMDLLGEERILRSDGGFSAAGEVEMRGAVALTDVPGAAVNFLAANLPASGG